jgi:hypothetical protein
MKWKQMKNGEETRNPLLVSMTGTHLRRATGRAKG